LPGSTATTAPPRKPGYTGPRFYTLLRGDDWNDLQVGIPAAVPYTFATRAMSNYAETESGTALPGFAGTSGGPLTEIERTSIRRALDAWEQVSGLTFVEVSDPGQWNFHGIRFLMESVDVQDLLGQAIPSGDPYGFNIVFNRFAYAGATLQPGTPGFWTALHEVGHAIGLKHPFDGDPVLKASEDNNNNTVMSYTDKGNLSHLGPFDVDAVRHLYGAPEAKASAPVQWFQGPDRSMVIVANDQDNYILGSVARDTVYGGGGSDYIKTDAGDDYVIAGAGNDAVFGNGGADVLYIGRLHSQAAITISYIEESEEVQGTVLTANDELDTFYGIETLDFINGSVATDPVQRRRQALAPL
jgi:serralysin